MLSVDRVLSRTGLLALVFLIAIPVLWPLGAEIEGKLLPVTKRLSVESVTPDEGGVSFYVNFDKVRQCKYIGIAWYLGDNRLVLELEPDNHLAPPTRPTGGQYIGPWRLLGVNTLKGTHAFVFHRCHFLWQTVTPFYP